MEKNHQLVARWLLVTAVLITLLGAIHTAATPIIFRTGFESLSQDNLITSIYMFAATGIFLMFVGAIAIYSARGVKRLENWALTLSTWIGVFVALFAISAVAVMVTNPFAYIMLVIALANLALLLAFRPSLQRAMA
jgi:pheromone shutdown protein TraB